MILKMYNPFGLLHEQLLEALKAKGKRYFVRQAYNRGWEPGLKGSFLLRAYAAHERDLAHEHFQFLGQATGAFLYDTQDPEHEKKLHIAASQPAGYKVYYAGKKGVDWTPPPVYRENMKAYIQKNHPQWQKKSNAGKIRIGMNEEFGFLFLTFSCGEEIEKIPFEQIENF